jgi:hypothetical protein
MSPNRAMTKHESLSCYDQAFSPNRAMTKHEFAAPSALQTLQPGLSESPATGVSTRLPNKVLCRYRCLGLRTPRASRIPQTFDKADVKKIEASQGECQTNHERNEIPSPGVSPIVHLNQYQTLTLGLALRNLSSQSSFRSASTAHGVVTRV